MKIKSVLVYDGSLIITIALMLASSKLEDDNISPVVSVSTLHSGSATFAALANAGNTYEETANILYTNSRTCNFTGTPSASGTAKFTDAWEGQKSSLAVLTGMVTDRNSLSVVPEEAFFAAQQRTALANMLASFTPAQLTNAKIAATFNDVLLCADKEAHLPSTKQGINAGQLSAASQAKVLAAIKPWLTGLDPATAAALLTTFTKQLSDTFITYAHNQEATSGNADSFLTANADYVRIDGPGVWMEFVCKPGVVNTKQVRYHTVFHHYTTDNSSLN